MNTKSGAHSAEAPSAGVATAAGVATKAGLTPISDPVTMAEQIEKTILLVRA